MRRLQALLIGAGLAVAPSGAVAGPDTTFEHFESTTITSRARLGVMVIQLTPELRTHFGAAKDRGVLVGRVEPRSAAAAAGVVVGDLITEVGGTVVDEASDVIGALATTKAGDKVTLDLIRDGKPLTLTATMRDNPVTPSSLFDGSWNWSKRWPDGWPSWLRDWLQPAPPPTHRLPDKNTSA